MKEISVDLSKILPRVHATLADCLYKQEKKTLYGLETDQVMKRPFSVVTILIARTSNGPQKLVMKTIVHHTANRTITERQNQAVVEYEILKNLHAKFQEIEKCSVPRPILVVPELETFIMEFVDGRLLTDELRWARYFSPRKKFMELLDHFYNSGRWLKHFQKFTEVRLCGPEALNGVVQRTEERLRLIQKSQDPRCPKDLHHRVEALLKDKLKELSGREIPVSGRHSDFHTWNILTGRNGITVIDFLGYQEDCVAVDVLKMLVHLEDDRVSLTANPRHVEALEKRFLEGYGELPVIPVPALIICEAMQRIVSLWRTISGANCRLHHRIEANLRIKEHVRWLIGEGRRRLLWHS